MDTLTMSALPVIFHHNGCSYGSKPPVCSPAVPCATGRLLRLPVLLAESGYKSCTQAFATDQFDHDDQHDPGEATSKSFLNL